MCALLYSSIAQPQLHISTPLFIPLNLIGVSDCGCGSLGGMACVRISSTSKWPFFFMVHHIPSSTSTLPTSLITRPTHIADRYDIDTSLVSLVPPPNSLRRSPTAYRCNKYQEKPYILLQRHYIIAPPYVLYQPPQQM